MQQAYRVESVDEGGPDPEPRNRRREERVDTLLQAQVCLEDERNSAFALDLCASGVQLMTFRDYNTGTPVQLDLELADDLTLALKATNRWSVQIEDSTFLGGFEFETNHFERLQLRAWLREHR